MRPLLFLLPLALPLATLAQTASPARHATVIDLTAASGAGLHSVAGAAWRLWGLDAGGRFQAGLGLRASHFFGSDLTFDSQTGPADATLQVVEPRSLALNAALHLRARVAGPVSLGFNIDLAGLTFGPYRPGQRNYVLPPGGLPPRPNREPDVTEPVFGNLLLGGSRDQGSLNSELYASLALPRGFSARVGFGHVVTAQAVGSERYRRFRNQVMLGLSWQLP